MYNARIRGDTTRVSTLYGARCKQLLERHSRNTRGTERQVTRRSMWDIKGTRGDTKEGQSPQRDRDSCPHRKEAKHQKVLRMPQTWTHRVQSWYQGSDREAHKREQNHEKVLNYCESSKQRSTETTRTKNVQWRRSTNNIVRRTEHDEKTYAFTVGNCTNSNIQDLRVWLFDRGASN